MRYRFRYWHKKSKGYIAKDKSELINLPQKAFITEQCTGLKDTNDKYIYEGDIVKSDISDKVGVVYWAKDCAGFAIEFKRTIEPFFEENPTWYEVIGNINENPELITW